MQELMKRVGNRYLLVNLAAQRARDILDEAEESNEKLPDKAVKLALDEIASGMVVYRPGPRTEIAIPQNNPIAVASMIDVDDSAVFDDHIEYSSSDADLDVDEDEKDGINDDDMSLDLLDEEHRLGEFDDEELGDGDIPVEDL